MKTKHLKIGIIGDTLKVLVDDWNLNGDNDIILYKGKEVIGIVLREQWRYILEIEEGSNETAS